MADLRFPTALQIMLSLALARREGIHSLSSAQLAQGLATNPSFVRRILGLLLRAGLVATSAGKGGGTTLAGDPDKIRFDEIYAAVSAGRKHFEIRTDIPHQCLVTRGIGAFLENLDAEVNEAYLGLFARRTLSQALDRLENIDPPDL